LSSGDFAHELDGGLGGFEFRFFKGVAAEAVFDLNISAFVDEVLDDIV